MLEDCRDQEPVSKTKIVHFYSANPFNTRDQVMRMVYKPSKKEKKSCTLAAFEKIYHTFPECPTPSPL